MGKTILSRAKAVELIQEAFKDNNFASLSLQQIFSNKNLAKYKSLYKNEESYESAIKWNLEVNSKDSKLWDQKNNIFENRNIGEGIWGVVGDKFHEYEEIPSTHHEKKASIFKKVTKKNKKVKKEMSSPKEMGSSKKMNPAKEMGSSNLMNSELDDDLKLVVTKKVTLNNDLASEIKARADHKCEYCGQQTFQDEHGESYLEVHHIDFLCNGGKDQKGNLIALCPTCHRRAHSSQDKEEFKEELKNIVQDKN